MKKPLFAAVVIAVVGLLLGWGVGSFLGYRSAIRTIEKLPAAPIVISGKYEKSKHSVILGIYNPGRVPIRIVKKSFVFKPGEKSSIKGYVISDIPSNMDLLPGKLVFVELNLKKGTEPLLVGDVVAATITYGYPSISDDVYEVFHIFEYKENKGSKKSKSEKEKKADKK